MVKIYMFLTPLYIGVVSKASKALESVPNEGEDTSNNGHDVADENVVRLTKAEKRAKFKKLRKEAKKQGKEVAEIEEVHQTAQAEVLVYIPMQLVLFDLLMLLFQFIGKRCMQWTNGRSWEIIEGHYVVMILPMRLCVKMLVMWTVHINSNYSHRF